MEKNFLNVPSLRTSGPLTVREVARLVGLQLQIGKVRQARRGALHAMDPRLYMCAVPFVARAERGSSALIVSVSAMRTVTMYTSEDLC